jgi:hypothetical protein
VNPFSIPKGHLLVTCTLRFLRSRDISLSFRFVGELLSGIDPRKGCIGGWIYPKGRLAQEQDSSEDWFLVKEGLKTVSAPIIEGEERRVDLRAIQELREFQKVLQVAKENKVGLQVAVDF